MNGLKYSPASQKVLVGISSTEAEARVWVKDQGQGLTPEAQEKVWDRFSPISDFSAYQMRGGGGLGLGLYISRAIILQHGGQVGVESIPEKGATFWFTLPLLHPPAV
jgi:signal transduction histidine kinase